MQPGQRQNIIYLCIYLSIYLSMYLSIYLSKWILSEHMFYQHLSRLPHSRSDMERSLNYKQHTVRSYLINLKLRATEPLFSIFSPFGYILHQIDHYSSETCNITWGVLQGFNLGSAFYLHASFMQPDISWLNRSHSYKWRWTVQKAKVRARRFLELYN